MEEIRVEQREVTTRCPYCLDDLVDGGLERTRCEACSAPLHAECLAELGSCAACGAEAGRSEATAPANWVSPPMAVRERCSSRHVKARRQGGVRRSGLCTGCHEAWLAACRDGTVAALLEASREQRERRRRHGLFGRRLRASRRRSSGVSPGILAICLAVATLATGALVFGHGLVAMILLYLAVTFATRESPARRRGGDRIPGTGRGDGEAGFGPRAVEAVFGAGHEEEGEEASSESPVGDALEIRVHPRSELEPEEPEGDLSSPSSG